jgi:hypothetical protein
VANSSGPSDIRPPSPTGAGPRGRRARGPRRAPPRRVRVRRAPPSRCRPERARLAPDLARPLGAQRAARELHLVHLLEQWSEPRRRYRAAAAQRGEQLARGEREGGVAEPRREVVAHHVDHQRRVTSSLSRVDEAQRLDARELALRGGVGIDDERRRRTPPPPTPEPDEQREERERGEGEERPHPPRNRRGERWSLRLRHAERAVGGEDAADVDGQPGEGERPLAVRGAHAHVREGDGDAADVPGDEAVDRRAVGAAGDGDGVDARRIQRLDIARRVGRLRKVDRGAGGRAHADRHAEGVSDGDRLGLHDDPHLQRRGCTRLRRGALLQEERGEERGDHRLAARVSRARKNLISGST